MSRTRRNTQHANINARSISFIQYLRAEESSLLEIQESGYNTSNRHSQWQSRIPTNWDDLRVSAYYETYQR